MINLSLNFLTKNHQGGGGPSGEINCVLETIAIGIEDIRTETTALCRVQKLTM